MITRMLQHIPLKFAYLCQDCDSIGNCATSCPACASHSLMGLSAVLDRQVMMHERKPVTEMPQKSYPEYTAMVA